MDRGKTVSLTFKPSRLTEVLEAITRNEMVIKNGKAGAATRPAAADVAAQSVGPVMSVEASITAVQVERKKRRQQ